DGFRERECLHRAPRGRRTARRGHRSRPIAVEGALKGRAPVAAAAELLLRRTARGLAPAPTPLPRPGRWAQSAPPVTVAVTLPLPTALRPRAFANATYYYFHS